MIEPKILKGFRDSLPHQEIVRQNLISKVQKIFRNFGFVPIDTPAIEYTEVLLGKGGGETDKQMYRFSDNGERDVALRFDLTVPLARFVAANYSLLSFPFKRYHIAKVWRGEKPQKGRFREFYQCDFDIIGADNPESDFEILLLIHTCLSEMKVGDFKVLVSHRGLLNKYLEKLGLLEKNTDILRNIDKLGKIGTDGVVKNLIEIGLTDNQCTAIIDFINTPKTSFKATLDKLTEFFGHCDEIDRLSSIYNLIHECRIENNFVLDTSITRGLDYYTGIVYETVLINCPQVGSICSGGRYNNLAGLYTKENLPGVGSCIGIDRLITALEETDSPIIKQSNFADVMIVKTPNNSAWAEKTAIQLRNKGIKTEVYIGDKPLPKQYAYAENNEIRFVILEENDNCFKIKDISNRTVFDCPSIDKIVSLIHD